MCVYFTVFCYILWAFGIVRSNFVYFSRFGILCQEKSGNPAPKPRGWLRLPDLIIHSENIVLTQKQNFRSKLIFLLFKKIFFKEFIPSQTQTPNDYACQVLTAAP
jgi:hypothetical protein